MTQFLILCAFGAMVWAAGVTILYIRACGEIDALKRDAKESGERAKFYSDHSDRQSAAIHRLEKENAQIGVNLLLCREYAKKLRTAQGCRHIEIAEVHR